MRPPPIRNSIVYPWIVYCGLDYMYLDCSIVFKHTLRTNQPELWQNDIKLHQDNAWPHTVQITVEKTARLGWILVAQLSNSPDSGSFDFHLLGSFKSHLCGREFDSDMELTAWAKR